MELNPAIKISSKPSADPDPRKSVDTLSDDTRNTAPTAQQNPIMTSINVANPAKSNLKFHINPPRSEGNLDKPRAVSAAAVQRPAGASLSAITRSDTTPNAEQSIKGTASKSLSSVPETNGARKPVQKSIRKLRGTTIGAEALVGLASSYRTHFSEYSKGRKKVVQKVPAAVWRSVYSDYLVDQRAKCEAIGEVFNKENLPQERTLQDALRSALNEIGTGVSDEAAAAKATLQNEDLMMRLKKSDTYNKKKMCQFRESLVSTTSSKSNTDKGLTGGAGEIKSSGLPDVPKKPMTKKEIMEGAVSAINDMVHVVENGSAKLCQVLQSQNSIVNADVQGKTLLRESQKAALESEEIDRKLKRLIILRDNGIITEDEFKDKMRSISGI